MPASENKLRMVCGEIITKSKLTKPSKLQLLKFVKEEADIHQLKALLLDGEIKTKLSEEDREIIDTVFSCSDFDS